MGDRVSVSFRKDGEDSVVLFHHWGGKAFPKEALEYAKELQQEVSGKAGRGPLDRLEPETIMVDFIRHITKGQERVNDSLYLGRDSKDGDNSDNGHWIVDLNKMELIQANKGEYEN